MNHKQRQSILQSIIDYEPRRTWTLRSRDCDGVLEEREFYGTKSQAISEAKRLTTRDGMEFEGPWKVCL